MSPFCYLGCLNYPRVAALSGKISSPCIAGECKATQLHKNLQSNAFRGYVLSSDSSLLTTFFCDYVKAKLHGNRPSTSLKRNLRSTDPTSIESKLRKKADKNQLARNNVKGHQLVLVNKVLTADNQISRYRVSKSVRNRME